MNISEAGKISNLPTRTIRYYSEIGLVNPSFRTESGYRIYDDETIKELGFIKRIRSFGFSIKDCRILLRLLQDKERASADVKKIAQKRLLEIENKKNELDKLYNELLELINFCPGDDKPSCPIIETLTNNN